MHISTFLCDLACFSEICLCLVSNRYTTCYKQTYGGISINRDAWTRPNRKTDNKKQKDLRFGKKADETSGKECVRSYKKIQEKNINKRKGEEI